MIKKNFNIANTADDMIAIKITNESTNEILEFINEFIKDNGYQTNKQNKSNN